MSSKILTVTALKYPIRDLRKWISRSNALGESMRKGDRCSTCTNLGVLVWDCLHNVGEDETGGYLIMFLANLINSGSSRLKTTQANK